MLTEKTFALDGISMNYAEGPASGMPLVLLHGVTTRWQTFLPAFGSLMPRFQLFALDMRGHGKSSWSHEGYSNMNDVADVTSFLRMEVQKPVALLGWSLGALVALTVAADAPELVRALVLVDPPLAELTDDNSGLAGFHEYFRALHGITTRDCSNGGRRAAFNLLHSYATELELRSRYAEVCASDPNALLSIIEKTRFKGQDLSTLLPKIQCPVLLMQGNPGLGAALDDTHAARSKSLLADCVHVVFSDVGHDIHSAQPIKFAQFVTEFLETL